MDPDDATSIRSDEPDEAACQYVEQVLMDNSVMSEDTFKVWVQGTEDSEPTIWSVEVTYAPHVHASRFREPSREPSN